MKKNIFHCTIALFTLFVINKKAFAQKNYFSIETGTFNGGPSANISNGFKEHGFGDLTYSSWNFFAIVIRNTNEYPQTSRDKSGWRMRYGRQLKNNNTIEVNFGHIHDSEVEGLDVISTGNRHINFKSSVSLLSSSYMLNNKKHSAGIGAGPALAFYKLGMSGYTEDTDKDTYSMNHNYLQPGVTASAFWRFINGKIFFMDLRSDFTMLAPAKINEISNKEGDLIFPSIKVNRSFFDVTIGAGIKL